ncbi:MAG: hypothetical protein ACJ8GN_28805 [Longimicrobiaceae bacterium]
MSSEPDRKRDDLQWVTRVDEIISSGDTREQMSVEDDDELEENASDDDFPDEPPPNERVRVV